MEAAMEQATALESVSLVIYGRNLNEKVARVFKIFFFFNFQVTPAPAATEITTVVITNMDTVMAIKDTVTKDTVTKDMAIKDTVIMDTAIKDTVDTDTANRDTVVVTDTVETTATTATEADTVIINHSPPAYLRTYLPTFCH